MNGIFSDQPSGVSITYLEPQVNNNDQQTLLREKAQINSCTFQSGKSLVITSRNDEDREKEETKLIGENEKFFYEHEPRDYMW